MPWSQTSPMNQKVLFIADHLKGARPVADLCAEYGISRKTAYKWIERYIKLGAAGLEDRSRRPRVSPNATADEVVAALIELRRHHPRWGAKKLLKILKGRHPRWKLPGRSACCLILHRHGLIRRKTRRRGYRSSRQAVLADPGPEPHLVRRLQRPVPHGQWPLLLSTDRHRCPQSLPARVPRTHQHGRGRGKARVLPPVPRVRTAAADPHRQRRPLCHQHTGQALALVGLVDTTRRHASADRAVQPAAERATRTHASHAQGRDHPATGPCDAIPTSEVRSLPAGVQS
jgi:transposase